MRRKSRGRKKKRRRRRREWRKGRKDKSKRGGMNEGGVRGQWCIEGRAGGGTGHNM